MVESKSSPIRAASGVRGFLVVLVLAVAGSFLWGYAQRNDYAVAETSFLSGDFHAGVVAQPAAQRTIRPAEYRRLWRAEAASEPFFGPLRPKVDARGHVYVADLGDVKIKELSPDGQPVTVYGEGKGQGPGELNFLNDFEVTSVGELWVSDKKNARVSVFEPSGRLSRTVRSGDLRFPYRLTLGPKMEAFVSLETIVSEDLFGVYDEQGRLLRRFGHLIEDQKWHSLALDGWLESDGEGGFVYAGLYTGILARYGLDGRQRFLVRTIDSRPLPKIFRAGRSMWVDPEAPLSTATLSVTGTQVHSFSSEGEGVFRRRLIDTYRKEDGSYLYSRPVPEPCTWLIQRGEHIYTVGEDMAVSKWEML